MIKFSLSLIIGAFLAIPVWALDDLMKSVHISASGMRVQGERLRIISQNIANSDSTGVTPGAEPYRRKVIYFTNRHDRTLGAEKVVVRNYGVDTKKEFIKKYQPSHIAADAQGYVLYPNVDRIIESVDAKEAQRTYEANLNSLEISKGMVAKTMDILK